MVSILELIVMRSWFILAEPCSKNRRFCAVLHSFYKLRAEFKVAVYEITYKVPVSKWQIARLTGSTVALGGTSISLPGRPIFTTLYNSITY